VDQEVKRLVEQFPEKDESDPFADFEDELEAEEFYDRLIVNLAGGDIIKGLDIMEKVTLIQALRWLLMRMSNE